MRRAVSKALAASCLLIATAIAGKAVAYTDVELFATLLSSNNTTYTGTFDIASKGYNSATQTVTNATVWFGLSDDSLLDRSEWVKFELGPQLDTLGTYEVDIFDAYSGQVTGSAWVQLDQTGTMNFAIEWLEGDFWALGAKLVAETGPRSVPDGGATLMLLGGALAGIEVLRRKAARKAKTG